MPARSVVDLHTHTTASDGTDAPAALATLARELGLGAIAITDHDHVAGVRPARAVAGEDLEVVAGVELSVDVPRGQLHLLGYFVNLDDPRFLATIADVREARGPRMGAILAKLAALGMPITEDEVNREADLAANPGKSIGRPHVAAAMLKRGYVSSVKEAFDLYLADGKSAHVPKRKLSPSEAVRTVLEAGGVPVLAHPFSLEAADRRSVVVELARLGLEGIEVVHSRQKDDVRAEAAAWARELDLVPTGGTDYHGANKPDVSLGSGVHGNVRVERDVLEALRARSVDR